MDFPKYEKIPATARNASKIDDMYIPKYYLPFPTKIYLGWNFERFSCAKCETETQEVVMIKNFFKDIENTYKHKIELYKLNKAVDFTKNNFAYSKISNL